MSIKDDQLALVMEAKKVFADKFGETLRDGLQRGLEMEQAYGEAIRAAAQHVDSIYYTAIAFFLTHDFVEHMNAMPANPMHVDISDLRFPNSGTYMN